MFFRSTLKNSVSVQGSSLIKDYSSFVPASGLGVFGVVCALFPNSTTNRCQAFSKGFQAGGAASRACRTGLHGCEFKVSINIELLAFCTIFNLEVQAAQDVNSSNNSLMFLAVFVSLPD